MENKLRTNNNISLVPKTKCFSCRACELSCPTGAISMREDEEGFLYPEVDGTLCTNCRLCVKKCQALNPPEKGTLKEEAFAVFLKDAQKLSQSTSGGAFAGFAEKILSEGGVVFGAAYDENLYPVQTCVESLPDLQKLKGSKYVESDTADSFRKAKQLLDSERKVLYSGTPCQIAGLRVFLGKEYDNLFTVDLICHGVPSRKLFARWLEWLGKKAGGKIIYVGFRDKDVGGWTCGGKFKTKTKTKTIEGSCDPYYASFLRCETYRESCYTCPYAKAENRPGDITIGDFWGIENVLPQFAKVAKNGVSLIIINTERGRQCFSKTQEFFSFAVAPISEAAKYNENLRGSSVRPFFRDTAYDGIDGNCDEYFGKFKCKSAFKLRARKILLFPARIVFRVLPASTRNWLRKFFKN